jgi:hypothetical protein
MASCDIVCQEMFGLFVNAKFGKPALINFCAHNVVMGIMVDSQLEIKRIHYLGVDSRVTPLEKEYYILCATVLTPVLGHSLLEHGHRQGGCIGAHLESQNPIHVFEGLPQLWEDSCA